MPTHKITKISTVEQSQLQEFYKKVYFDRYKNLKNNWTWWYRSNHSQYETLILLLEKKVVGQAGLQPVNLNINGEKILAAWFLDFIILPEFRGKGFGKILTKKLMETCPNLITFCNEKTLNIVKKLGWEYDTSVSRFARPINPLKFIPVVQKLNFGDAIFRNFLKKKFYFENSIKPMEISNNYEVVLESFKKRQYNNLKDSPEIIRDEKWLYWRLMECPYKKDIYFFEYKNNFSIVRIFQNKGIKRLHILFTYFIDQFNEKELFNLIMQWSINNNIDLLWAIKKENNENLKDVFPNKFKKPLTFASWSSNEKIAQSIKNVPHNSQAIDSDNDSKMFVE
tara:strand:+ start:82 stop:1095 length:1014 start_codon:yes stop_codon:yes gene_type:complete